MRARGYNGPIVSTSLFPEQEQELLENGIDEVFNIYEEAGSGAATRMYGLLESRRRPRRNSDIQSRGVAPSHAGQCVVPELFAQGHLG